jgi:uncharacterized membrane protein YfcA
MMGLQQVRWTMVGLLAAAAVLSVVGKMMNDRFIGWLAFVCFIGSVFLYMDWRRRVAASRRAKVFDRKAKTDETGTSPDE